MWKNGKKSGNLFCQSYNKCLISEYFSLGQISFNHTVVYPYLAYSQNIPSQNEKFHNSLISTLCHGYCFLHFSRFLFITCLVTLSLKKLIIVLEKSLEFWIQNLYKPCAYKRRDLHDCRGSHWYINSRSINHCFKLVTAFPV